MRPTTPDDNVFDFDALLHPGTVFDHPNDVVSHAEILEALCDLDGGPRNPPGGKPYRLRSTERAIAA
jgi:hypothetical protein